MESSPSVSGQSCSLYPLGESRGMQPDPDDEWGGTLVQRCVWPHRHWPGLSGGSGMSNLTCWPLQMCCHGTGKGTTFPPLTAGSQFCARGNTNLLGWPCWGRACIVPGKCHIAATRAELPWVMAVMSPGAPADCLSSLAAFPPEVHWCRCSAPAAGLWVLQQ